MNKDIYNKRLHLSYYIVKANYGYKASRGLSVTAEILYIGHISISLLSYRAYCMHRNRSQIATSKIRPCNVAIRSEEINLFVYRPTVIFGDAAIRDRKLLCIDNSLETGERVYYPSEIFRRALKPWT